MDSRRKVYYIAKTERDRPANFYTQQLFTAPFYSIERRDMRNVLLAFTSTQQCENAAAALLPENASTDAHLLVLGVHSIKLEDLKYMSSILKVPLVVIINSFCDLESRQEGHEIFYHYNMMKFAKPERLKRT